MGNNIHPAWNIGQSGKAKIMGAIFSFKMKKTKNKIGYSTGDVLRILKIPKYKLYYLFESRKIIDGDVFRLPNGRRVYTEKMLEKIRGLLK